MLAHTWNAAHHQRAPTECRCPGSQRVQCRRAAGRVVAAAAPATTTYPMIILPGFGNNTADYTAPFGNSDQSLATHLQARGCSTWVVPLERKDWFKVARNLLTLRFWTSSLTTDPGYTWYLQRLHETVLAAQEATGADKVHLVGHSAGGWLARAYVADPAYNTQQAIANEEPNPAVASLTSLGTPHIPPAPGTARDMTGGALTWLHTTYPGTYWAPAGVRYVCVAGRAVRGDRDAPKDTLRRYAYSSYSQVTGEGHEVEGDAVVPCAACLLEGAEQVVLDGVYHSMARFGTFDEPHQDGVQWYGSDSVIDSWLPITIGTGVTAAAVGNSAVQI